MLFRTAEYVKNTPQRFHASQEADDLVQNCLDMRIANVHLDLALQTHDPQPVCIDL